MKKKRKRYVPKDKLLWYFNISARTYSNYTKLIDMHELYHQFVESRTLREQKDILYGLKPKVKEELLDSIWNRYILKIERNMLRRNYERRK